MINKKTPEFIRVTKKFFVKIFKDDIFGLAAEMGFYLLTAFFPFIILLFIVATNVSDKMQSLLFNLIRALPAEAETVVMNMLLNMTSSVALIVTTSVIALWCTSNVINTLKKALNRFYGTKEARGFIKTRLICILFSLIIIIMIVLSFALIIFGEGTGLLLRYLNYFKFANTLRIWDWSRYIAIIFVFLIAMVAIFKILPSKKLSFGSVISGSILTTAAWCISSWGFSYYVNNFSKYHVLYGSIAGVVILTTWIYISGYVILLGGALNAFWYRTGKAKRLKTIKSNKQN